MTSTDRNVSEEIVYFDENTLAKARLCLVREGFSTGAAITAIDALVEAGFKIREKLPYIQEEPNGDGEVRVEAARGGSGTSH